MNADGSGVQRLTTHNDSDTSPTWRPDSTQIAFTSARTGDGDIYTMNANGSSQTRRTTSSGLDTEPAWCGTSIAFSTNRHGSSNFEIYRMAQTGGSETRLTNLAGHDVTPTWSPDGQKIAFATNRSPATGLNFNIYTMNANGSSQTALVTHAVGRPVPRLVTAKPNRCLATAREAAGTGTRRDPVPGIPPAKRQGAWHEREIRCLASRPRSGRVPGIRLRSAHGCQARAFGGCQAPEISDLFPDW